MHVATIVVEVKRIEKIRRQTMGTWRGVLRLQSGEMSQVVDFVYRGDLTITYLVSRSVYHFPHVLEKIMDRAIIERIQNEKEYLEGLEKRKGKKSTGSVSSKEEKG